MSFPSSAHYNMLMHGMRSLNEVTPLISKAEACGMDCTEYRQGHAYLQDTISRFLHEFFPDQITPPSEAGSRSTAE